MVIVLEGKAGEVIGLLRRHAQCLAADCEVDRGRDHEGDQRKDRDPVIEENASKHEGRWRGVQGVA